MTRGLESLWVGLLMATATIAPASELSVGRATVQRLIGEQLFTDKGRWYLSEDGPCYAYLDHPQTRLAGGRVYIDARMSSRLGLRAGETCIGATLASNVTLSGRLIGQGSVLTLSDIRVDQVADADARGVLELLLSAAPELLPKAMSIDVLTAVRGAPLNAGGFPVTVRAFHILDVATTVNAVIVRFDLSVTAP